MLFLIIIIALFVVSVTACRIATRRVDMWSLEVSSMLLCIACGFILLFIPLSRLSDRLFIEEIKTFEQTVEDSRESQSEIERAAILGRITEINRRLAKAKYLNKTFIGDIFVVDDLSELEYLK